MAWQLAQGYEITVVTRLGSQPKYELQSWNAQPPRRAATSTLGRLGGNSPPCQLFTEVQSGAPWLQEPHGLASNSEAGSWLLWDLGGGCAGFVILGAASPLWAWVPHL